MKVDKDKRTNPENGTNGGRSVGGSQRREWRSAESREMNLLKLPPLTSPNDSNMDPWTLDALLQQSYHLVSMLRMSMGSWIISSEVSRNKKIAVTKRYEIPSVAIEMPLEIILSKSRLLEYMELCAGFGMNSIEYWNGHPDAVLTPREVVQLAKEYELEVLARVGSRRGSEGEKRKNFRLMDESKAWLDSGAKYLVVDPFETNARLLPPKSGLRLKGTSAENLVVSFGLHSVMFDAPATENQKALIDHFGPEVRLCGVRLEDILVLESYRRQPYSGFFGGPKPVTFLPEAEKARYNTPGDEEGVKKALAETEDISQLERR